MFFQFNFRSHIIYFVGWEREREGDGCNREVGYMGRTPPWWGHTPPRHPRLGHRRRWAPCPKPIFSLHFHPRGKFLLFIQSNIHYKILILLYHLLRFAPFFSRTRFYIFFYFIKLKFKKSNCLPCLFFFHSFTFI